MSNITYVELTNKININVNLIYVMPHQTDTDKLFALSIHTNTQQNLLSFKIKLDENMMPGHSAIKFKPLN